MKLNIIFRYSVLLTEHTSVVVKQPLATQHGSLITFLRTHLLHLTLLLFLHVYQLPPQASSKTLAWTSEQQMARPTLQRIQSYHDEKW